MDTHVRILGLASIAYGVFAGLVSLWALIWYGGIVAVWNEAENVTGMGLIGAIMVVLLLLVSIPYVVGGFGVLRYREWARQTIMIASAVNMLNFPIGSVLSAYSFWVLTQHETEPLFRTPLGRRPPAQHGRNLPGRLSK